MKKRLLSILLAMTMLLTLLPAEALAQDASTLTSGTCGENLTWSYNDGVLHIQGTGDMEDYHDKRPWDDFREQIHTVTIDNGVDSIGQKAFSDCTSLTSVAIPESVTSIESYAFQGCTSLTSISIPEGVWYIGSYMFFGCTSLADVTIPEGVKIIGGAAFEYCTSLTSVTIPEGVSSINGYMFSGCSRLRSVTIPESVTSIGAGAFEDCASLNSMTIPKGVTSIGDWAFSGCTSLADVYYSGSKDDWENISIGSSNEQLLNTAIHYNHTGSGTNPVPNVVASGTCGENLTWNLNDAGTLTISGTGAMTDYTLSSTAPWNNRSGLIKNVVIENNVVSIGRHAFRGCASLNSVTVGNSVTSIGSDAFDWCQNLTHITIPSSVTTIELSVFDYCSGLTSAGPIGSGCNYEFGWTEKIPERAFYGISLTSATIPDSITSIESYAFYGCGKLTSIKIPNNVTNIGEYAFSGCRGVTSVTIPDSVANIGKYAFARCADLVNVSMPKGIVNIGSGVFSGCNSLTDATLPNSINTIRDHLFEDCTGLTSMVIPNDVTHIEGYAFYGCSSLPSLTIPNGVTNIEERAFARCSALVSIIIPDSVTRIGPYAFDSCSNLKHIYYAGSQDEWAKVSYSYDVPSAATIHYNSTGPDTPAGDIIIDNGNPSRTIKVGETITFPVSVPNPNGLTLDDITFTSSDEDLARVSVANKFDLTEMGLLSFTLSVGGLAAGTTTITVSASDGRSKSCTVIILNESVPNHVSALLPGPNSELSLQDIWRGNNIPNLQFTMKFSKNIIPGTGKVYLKDYETDENIQVIKFQTDDSDTLSLGRLDCNNDTLKILFSTTDMEHPIPAGKKLYVMVEPDAILFEDGSTFDGILNKDTWYVNTEFGLTKYEEIVQFSNGERDFFNSGDNKTYQIASRSLQEKLEKIIGKTELKNQMNQKFGGACFGTSVVTALYKMGIIDLTDFDPDASNLYRMKYPKKSTHAGGVRDLINYYYLLQRVDSYKMGGPDALLASMFRNKSAFTDALKEIVNLGLNMEQSKTVLVLNYGWMQGISSKYHSVVLCSAEKNDDGSYNLIVKDPELNQSLSKMNISSDFSKLTITTDDGDFSVVIVKTLDVTTLPSDWLIDGDAVLSSDSIVASMEDTPDYDILKVVAYGNFTITNSSGETLVHENGYLSGTMEILREDFVDSGIEDYAEFVYYVPMSDGYTFQSTDSRSNCTVSDGEQYLSVSAENATSITLNKAAGISVQGSNLVYDAYATTATGTNMFAVSGETGTNLEIFLASNGSAEITADSMENVVFQSLYDDTSFTFDSSTNTAKVVETDQGSLTLDGVEVHEQTLFSTSLKDAGDYVEAIVTNNTALPQTATVLIAMYQPNGQFVKTEMKELEFDANQTVTFSLTERNVEYKLFVTSSLDTWGPIGSSAKFRIGG